MINVTSKDVLASVLLPAGWYIVEVKRVTRKPANTDQSTNFNFQLETVADLKGGTEYAEVGMKQFLINEKALFTNGLAFLVACGFDSSLLPKLKAKEISSVPFNEEDCVGQKIKAAIKTTTYEGRQSNEAYDFLPWDGKYL